LVWQNKLRSITIYKIEKPHRELPKTEPLLPSV
jgi:hypothetical protein